MPSLEIACKSDTREANLSLPGAPRPPPPPTPPGAAALRAAISAMVTAPSPGWPTPLLAAPPRPPPPRAIGAPGNAAVVGRATLAVIPSRQVAEESRGVVLGERFFFHSMRPRSVSNAVRLPELLPRNARERNPRYPM